ncbi:hypothetical protein [Bradyrhizobium sp. SYSU BS000235]|uniref:hypothetical protein n=1 Tax=Bradyrhizobium sp. SYSU BS000235 TaxID=3411332 RepID=UPI003C71F092
MNNPDTAKLITTLRKSLHPYWVAAEAGGILLMGNMNDEDANRAIFGNLLALFPEIAASGDGKWESLADELCKLAHHFIETYQLTPGPYELDNYHRALAKDGELELNSWGSPPIKVPPEARFTFVVTSEHLTLIRNLNTRTWETFIELMDLKRPYGDMTYFYIDMAAALGEPVPRNNEGQAVFSAEAEQRYERLHGEMLFAVQAFWDHAREAPHQS